MKQVEPISEKELEYKFYDILRNKHAKSCYYYVKTYQHLLKDVQIKELEKLIMNYDKSGIWVLKFYRDVRRCNHALLEKDIINKNKSGDLIFELLKLKNNLNKKELLLQYVKKDMDGSMIFKLLKYRNHFYYRNLEFLENELLKKNKTMDLIYSYIKKKKPRNINKFIEHAKKSNNEYSKMILKELAGGAGVDL